MSIKKNSKKETLDEVPKFFKYPVKTIMNSIKLVTRGLLSLRGVSYAFKVFNHWYKGKIPSHTVVQNWVLRTGLYLYQQKPEQRDDWLLIADHTIEYGQKKCLLILGIRLERLLKNNNRISHEDVEVLTIDIEKKADAESVKNSFINVAENIGVPLQIVSDGGSNLKKGIKDFIETLDENVIQTYDVTHQASIILKRQLEGNERWNEFVTKISHTKRCLVHTALAFMAPRKPKEKARWLNLEIHLNWAYQAIVYGGKILTEQERKKYDERVGWVKDFKDDLDAWSKILAMTKLLQSEIKKNGLSSKSLTNLTERFKQNNIKIDTPASKEVNTQIEEYLINETINLKDAVMLGCSDIIESIFGKYKYFSAKSPMKEVGKSILTMPVFTSKITPELVLAAMEAVSIKQVDRWLEEKLGTSLYSRRKEFLAGV